MSVERSFEAWEEVQRHGQDLADRLAQGFTGLIHTRPPVFPCPNPHKSKLFDLEFPELHHFGARMEDLGAVLDHHGVNGVSAIIDIGSRIGQAGFELGTCLNGMMQQVFRRLPVPFKQEEGVRVAVGRVDGSKGGGLLLLGTSVQGELGLLSETLREFGFVEDGVGEGCQGSVGGGVGEGCQGSEGGGVGEGCQGSEGASVGVVDGVDDVVGGSDHLAKPQGTLNISSTYDSRNKSIESSLVAKGDLWRVEASQGSPTSGNENSPLFLVQLGPALFIRDRTLLLPVHGSKQHLLWYGYDRKNGVHSLCPAVWSKHGRWLLMPMLCLNPFTCSFVDLQFPNGQFTYVSGEGLTTSAFVPFCGGLLQVQGQCPGEMRFSFSHKNKRGTRITPMVQWPDKSFTLGFAQALAWQRSGLMVKPTVQFSLFPTFGGSNPGVRTELIHSVNDKLNLICGCAFTEHPSLFASVSVGRSKWNGNVGRSGVVVRVDTPLSNVGRPSFSVQINSGVEF